MSDLINMTTGAVGPASQRPATGAGFDFARLHATQGVHPVWPVISLERLVQLGPERAVELVNGRARAIVKMTPKHEREDLLRHGYDPPAWRRIDLEMARKRLAHPGACLELYVLGGHDGGKTNGAVMRMMRHFFYTRNAWVWGLHSTETSSKTIHQDRVFDFWPPELKAKLGKGGGLKRNMQQQGKFQEGSGFTNNRFNVKWTVRDHPLHRGPVTCGGLWEAKFFASDNKNLQGAKITFANADELADKDIKKTMVQRAIPRAQETNTPEFLEVVRQCVVILEDVDADGNPKRQLPPELQGILYTGTVILGFTPMEGYSALVASVLDGAIATGEEEASVLVPCGMEVPDSFPCLGWGKGEDVETVRRGDAERVMKDLEGKVIPRGMKRVYLLPVHSNGELVGCKMVPRFKQPKQPTQLVAYLHTHHNPFTNLSGKIADCAGQSESYIRVTYFGDVAKDWKVDFAPPFNELHHVIWDRKMIPRTGTWRLVIDPARARPWFMGLYMTDAVQRRYALREWPQEGSAIPGKGDPGAWAVISEHGKINGDIGPAQELRLGWGFAEYWREIWRLQMELGMWWFTEEEQKERSVKITWEKFPEWTLEGAPIVLEEMRFDPRFSQDAGAMAEGEQDYLEGMIEAMDMFTIEGPGAKFLRMNHLPIEAAPGKSLDIGNGLIVNALGGYDPKTYEPERPNPMNCPTFRVWHQCAAHLFTLANFAVDATRGESNRKDEACKDPRDCMAMHEQLNPYHKGARKEGEGGWRGGARRLG